MWIKDECGIHGRTLRQFQKWDAWQDLRKKHPRYSAKQFIVEILGLTPSAYYNTQRKILAKEEEWELYQQLKESGNVPEVPQCVDTILELNKKGAKWTRHLTAEEKQNLDQEGN